MAKKNLEPSPPMSRAGTLAKRLQESHEASEVYCASDIMKDWRYIDFYNPLQKTPCIALEWLFGARGLLAGRIIRLQASYGTGKSSFMWLMYAAGQALAKAWCYHVESEATPPPPDFIASFGCDPENLVIAHPRSLEQCLEGLDELMAQVRGGLGGSINPDTGKKQKTKYDDPLDKEGVSPIMAGIDSFSALGMDLRVQQDVLDQTDNPAVAEHSRKMSKYLQDRAHRFKQTQALLMIAAQEKTRIKTGMSRGGPDKTSIGDAPIGFHSTYCVDLSAYSFKDEAGKDVGERIVLWTSKNKLSPKHRLLDMYLVRDHGFDMVKTDADFLLKSAASPFTGEDAYRHSKGITCKPLSDKTFHSDEEFLQALYANKDLLMALRECIRVRGFGFNFESKYAPTPEEIEDNITSPKGDSDLHGVEGSEKPIRSETILS